MGDVFITASQEEHRLSIHVFLFNHQETNPSCPRGALTESPKRPDIYIYIYLRASHRYIPNALL